MKLKPLVYEVENPKVQQATLDHQPLTNEEMNLLNESELISIAHGPSDHEANKAMKLLREKFNSTYHFCLDFDQMALTENECQCD